MRLKSVTLSLVLFSALLASTSLQSQILIQLTNQLWRYDQSGWDPGAFWEREFDDALWPQGHGVFAYETDVRAALVANVYPYTNTVLLQPLESGISVVYFRTHFTFDLGDPNKYVLVASNLIDDGYVMYLNGREVDRYNMNPNDAQAALSSPGGEGNYVPRPLSMPLGLLTTGTNVLAVRVHQNAANSTDVVWGTVLHASLAPASFQDGTAGYNETQDTELHQGTPDANLGQSSAITADLGDPPPNQVQGLLRFDHIIGGSPGQVPFDSVINRATLRLFTTDETDASTRVRVLRMLKTWNESSTWNSLGNGINETNGVETESNAVLLDGGQLNGFDDVDVTAAVQAWANGQPNHGWAFLATGSNGWDFASSENSTVANRPRLLVDFINGPPVCGIVDDPDSVTVEEKQAFTLRVVSRGFDLTYQWYHNEVAIPGATSATYTVPRAIPADSGRYYVVVQNGLPTVCTSATAVVTVNADLIAPALTSALGNPDQSTITLLFNDTMDPISGGNATNYSIAGLSVSSAAVSGNKITLSTGVRAIGTAYTLTITGIRDDAVARNVIRPDPTSTNLPQQIRLLPFDAIWKFETNGLDLGTAWTEAGYADSAWPSAGALVGFETNMVPYANLGLSTNNMTLWQLRRPDGTANITYYLRTRVSIPYDLANAAVTLRHVLDDGAVVYFNGQERFRYNMPDGPVGYLTEAVAAPAEGVIRSDTLTGLNCGNNVVAVSVHNDSPTSTDILFGAELLATFTSFQPCRSDPPRLSIANNGNGTVTLSWSPDGGTLDESIDLEKWGVSPNQSNPQTFAPSGRTKFYRVR
jgi:hypothetical protein